jgi:hypothetical protein
MKTYTHEELHKLDPAKLISHEGRRLMPAHEVVRHLIDGDWPAETSTQKSETASHQEPRQWN